MKKFFIILVVLLLKINLFALEKYVRIIFPDNKPVFDKYIEIIPNGNYVSNIIKCGIKIENNTTNFTKKFVFTDNKRYIKISSKNLSDSLYYAHIEWLFLINGKRVSQFDSFYFIVSHTNYNNFIERDYINDLFFYFWGVDETGIKNIFYYPKIERFYNNLLEIGERNKVEHPVYYYFKCVYYKLINQYKKLIPSFLEALKQEKKYKNDSLLLKFKRKRISSTDRNFIESGIIPVINGFSASFSIESIDDFSTTSFLKKYLKIYEFLNTDYYFTSLENYENMSKLGRIYLYTWNAKMRIKENNIYGAEKLAYKALKLFRKYNLNFSNLPIYYDANPINLIHFELAYINYLKNNFKEMRVHLEKINKEYAGLKFIKGKLEYDKKEYDKSVRYFKESLMKNGNKIFISKYPELSFEGEIYNMMGMCYFKKGYYQIALDKFLSAVAAPDAIPVYKENLAVCYQKLGEEQKAKEILNELSDLPDLFLKSYMDALKRKIKYKPINNVPAVWVLPFNDVGGVVKRAGMGEYLQDVTMREIYKTKKFRIVDRDAIKQIIKEKKLSISKFGDKKYLKNKHKIISADYIITGNYSEAKNKYRLSMQMVSVADGSVVKIKTYQANNFENLINKINKFVNK